MKKYIFAAAVAAVAAVAVPAAASAAAVSPNAAQNVSFSASSDGASAHWSEGKGSPIDLTLGRTLGSSAVITLHNVPATAVNSLAEPTFTTDNYSAGSPRWYITLSDGHTLVGYPAKAGLNGNDLAWAIDNGNTYQPWSDIQSSLEGTAKVTGAWVIADADQTPGTTDVITNLTFGTNTYN